MSVILQVYAHIAEQELAVGGTPAKVYSLASLLQAVDTAKLPARLLAVTSGRNSGQGTQYAALRDVLVVRWQITDLLLYKPEGQGLGLKDVAEQLVAYAGAYAEMVKANRKPLPAAQRATAKIENVTVQPGLYEWPQGSTKYYFGVECGLDVEEIL